ncbi:hypothetical protein V22_11630 [Calycomorphotria hydatis]|uniref:Uncharacterized protein n=1 Tax=Calycomorphotria hydatis TaxID=2528027 RepID=A0A517T6D4_9PLAN|nr:hypothetical protein V22_11630 [Calycomorphotria hydatis]
MPFHVEHSLSSGGPDNVRAAKPSEVVSNRSGVYGASTFIDTARTVSNRCDPDAVRATPLVTLTEPVPVPAQRVHL